MNTAATPPMDRPNYAAGFELDGPYRRSPAQHAKRLCEVLASVWKWIKP